MEVATSAALHYDIGVVCVPDTSPGFYLAQLKFLGIWNGEIIMCSVLHLSTVIAFLSFWCGCVVCVCIHSVEISGLVYPRRRSRS